jgi:hypothetical protein
MVKSDLALIWQGRRKARYLLAARGAQVVPEWKNAES